MVVMDFSIYLKGFVPKTGQTLFSYTAARHRIIIAIKIGIVILLWLLDSDLTELVKDSQILTKLS
jgi:hypothetical protein